MNGGVVIFLLAYLGSLIWCSVICVQKGKTIMMVAGWVCFTPLIYIGAARIAKPNSKWAKERYEWEPFKNDMAMARFPKEAWIIKRLNEDAA